MVYGTRGEDFGEAIGNALSDLAVSSICRRRADGVPGESEVGRKGLTRGGGRPRDKRGLTDGVPRRWTEMRERDIFGVGRSYGRVV